MVTLEQQLSRLDLNLLVSLSVLIQEKSVTRAAEQLFLSQPAMSRTLGRLRELFDDPLFYRESTGLIPTQKALDLQEPLSDLLRNAQLIIQKSAFSPKKCENTFFISMPPLMSSFIAAPLASKLIQLAPMASMAEYPVAREPTQQLASRDVDFSIHIDEPSDSIEFPYTKIGSTYPVFYVPNHHPLVGKENVTLEDVVQYRFVDMSLDIRSANGFINPIDVHLAKKGLVRDIVYKSSQIFTLTELMQHSDTVMVSSHKLGSLPNVNDKLVPILALNEIAELSLDIYLIEHKRTLASEPHIWFRELIIQTVRDEIFND